jgi:Xaa-Pro aminopeptidase
MSRFMTHPVRRCIVAMSLLVGAAVPATGQEGSPAGAVPVARLQARRAALLQRLATGVAVVRSGTERSIEGDYPQDSDYRESNDFFYLTGIEAPGAWLVLVAEDSAPDRVLLFLEPRDSASEQWTGVKLGAADARRLTGVDSVLSADSAEAGIRRRVLSRGSPARRGALYLERDPDAADSEFLRRLVFSAGQGGGGLPVRDVATEIAALRLVKDADEVARLRRAIDITAEAQRRAMAMVKPGVWEYEIEAEIESTFRRRGAERVGFPSIVGSGPNSTTLHYDKNRRQTRAGDLVVADIGAEWGYYTADVTRTMPVSGRFTDRQRALYDLVLATQQAGIDAVRAGATVGDLERAARAYMREHSGTLCGEVTCDRYFVHGLSHWLGMDVHDVGSYATPLAPGMVVTVEPGIYIPQENIGIRIEDDVLVTAGAPEVLSAAAPRRAADIEALMARH